MKEYKLIDLMIFIFLFICFFATTYGQVPTHITNFNHKDYKGGIQNWGIAISHDRVLYAGNNNGLLRYNGNDWSLSEPEERGTIRAVYCMAGRIYTAGDNNIGFWERRPDGKMNYTSFLPLVNQMGINRETFWSIGSQGSIVYFQSFGYIIAYDGQQMSSIVKHECYSILLQTKDKLFTQQCGRALHRVSGNKLEDFSNDPIFQNEEVKGIFELSPDNYIIAFANGKLYFMENGTLSFYTQLKNENNVPVRIDCADIWEDQTVAFGTIGDGIFLVNLKDNQQTQIHSSQLQDLNVHGICFADENFLWLSLDNGVSSIVLEPEMYLWKSNKEIGTFFDAAYFNGKTYVATNQGMHIYEENGRKIQSSIYPLHFGNLKNELLCGTTTQLYKMTTQQPNFQPLYNLNGVSQFEYVSDRGDEYAFLRSYAGISLLHYRENTWKYLSLLVGTESYINIMPESLNTIWAVHSEKGVFRLRINQEMTEVTGSDSFSDIEGYSNYSNINIIKINENILFFTPRGIYLYDIAEKRFKRQDSLSSQILHLDKLQSVKTAYRNNIWIASNDELFLYSITDLSAKLLIHLPFVNNELTLYDKHFNFRSVNDSITFVATNEGTVVLNTNKINRAKQQIHPLIIDGLFYTDRNNKIAHANPQQPVIELPNSAKNITITVSAGLQVYSAYISFRLLGLSEEWSPWQASGTVQFTNLSSGAYKLEVKDSNQNTLIIPIEIKPPIYNRTWMIGLYILTLILITIGFVDYINRRKRKTLIVQHKEEQRKYAEKLQKQAYEQLQEKVANQENELKNRMRFLSQKQDLLDAISSEIESQKQELGDRYPNKLYQRLKKIIKDGTTEKDKFLSFENYFVEVHYEFMLRMQQLHSDLTASELKFCCLLRANLSTKEISVIMGIALRSVELKKYRLKQKLNLNSEKNLISYILTI